MSISRRTMVMGLVAAPALAQGAKLPSAFDSDVLALKPGEWTWAPQVAPAGPLTMVVNLATQRAHIYRNGVRIGASTISSGKKGKRTPTGVFQILQKNRDHRSNLYNDAPMPFMQRLTWDGIALHAGHLPGYPASHGCIRMPYGFAEQLFGLNSMGMTVVVLDEPVVPERGAADALLARFAPAGPGRVRDADDDPLDSTEVARFVPERATDGPVTIIVSTSSRRLVVYRAGVEIGRARLTLPDGFSIGTRAAQFAGRDADGNAQWVYLGLDGAAGVDGEPVPRATLEAASIPPQFLAQLRTIVGEGTTLLATDGGLISGSSGKPLTILANE